MDPLSEAVERSIRRIESGLWSWEMEIGKADGFAFACSSCGDCCRGEMEIRLNLADLQRMARYLGLETTEGLFTGGWVVANPTGAGGFRPVIRFREKPFLFCPFLENRLTDEGRLLGLCKLHPHLKPLVCKLAPVGREVTFDAVLRHETRWVFTEPVQGCPGCRVGNACEVDSWLAPYGDELKWELRYFRVMEAMQREGWIEEEYQRLHQELRVGEDIERYLEHWEQKMGLKDCK